MKSLPKPLTINEQIENLKKIGLRIDDPLAEKLLNEVSYYRIIKGFSDGLKDEYGQYKRDVTFSHIKSLYDFNTSLRHLILPEIEKIEIAFRCQLANYFSVKYGALGHKDPSNFSNAEYHASFCSELKNEIGRNKRVPFVKNFLDNYTDRELPFYAAVELLSFGTISKFYKNLLPSDKENIAKKYKIPYIFLESWLEHLSYVRNICAHYGRLYNVNFTKKPKLYREYRSLGINEFRLYSALLCIKHLLPTDDVERWRKFVANLTLILEDYPRANKQYLGFPKGEKDTYWSELLLTPLENLPY